MREVAESEVFNVTQDYAYHAFLLLFFVHDGHSQFAGKGRRSEEELRDLFRDRPVVITEWEYPKSLTVDRLNGPATVRTALRFMGLASRTVVVTWEHSLHPQNFLGRALTAIPRRRMEKAAPEIRETLWRLKMDFEGHAFDHALKDSLGPDHLSKLDPPDGRLQTVIDAGVWHQGMTLLEGASYFEVLREELGSQAAHLGELAQELEFAGRFYLSLSSEEGFTDDELDTAKRTYVENFARLAESEHTYDHELLSRMMLYFMSLRKNIIQISQDAQRLHEQAQGNRVAMAKLLLEYAAPDFEEMARIAQGMPGSQMIIPFREWAARRRSGAVNNDDDEPPSSSTAGAGSVKEIRLSCAWCDSTALMEELTPYVDNVTFEVRNQGPRFRGSGIDSTVLVALITGGSAVLSALIATIAQRLTKKSPDGASRIYIKGSAGTTIEVPRDFSTKQLREIVEIAQTLDRPRIHID